MGNFEKIDLSNFCETSEEEGKIDEFKDTEKRIEKFNEILFPIPIDDDKNYNSFVNATLFTLRLNQEQKTDCCNLEALKDSKDNNLFIQLNQEKSTINLDYQKLNNQCHEVHMILAKHGYFLGMFELKNKFRYLILKDTPKNIVRHLLSNWLKRKIQRFSCSFS